MSGLDEKQRRLIDAWLNRPSADAYSRYMFRWVAFNAFCYALFADEAARRRPDLDDDRGLEGLAGEVRAEGSIDVRVNGLVRIRLDVPGRIRIDIRERYTEDLVFSAFARRFQSTHLQWLAVPGFAAELTEFLAAISRPAGAYVINMLRAQEHRDDRDLDEMAARNIVAPITDRADLGLLVDALYQIRNNMFHGEKVPGDVNDDRIVKVATPVLESIVRRAYETTAELLL